MTHMEKCDEDVKEIIRKQKYKYIKIKIHKKTKRK